MERRLIDNLPVALHLSCDWDSHSNFFSLFLFCPICCLSLMFRLYWWRHWNLFVSFIAPKNKSSHLHSKLWCFRECWKKVKVNVTAKTCHQTWIVGLNLRYLVSWHEWPDSGVWIKTMQKDLISKWDIVEQSSEPNLNILACYPTLYGISMIMKDRQVENFCLLGTFLGGPYIILAWYSQLKALDRSRHGDNIMKKRLKSDHKDFNTVALDRFKARERLSS